MFVFFFYNLMNDLPFHSRYLGFNIVGICLILILYVTLSS